MSQLWFNHSLLNFFFRSQAESTLNELMDRTIEGQGALDKIEDYAEESGCNLDDIEEMFYNDTVEELAEEFGIRLEDEGDEDEDEDEESEKPWDYGKHFD